ncbi:T9SS type A sorting domain-containing protein [Flavobacterium sp.]|uniref:T9SS type A sorting domain-containing protein n=1 Tax=Flavobacterium sp. TaxID=239 RepID=UPI00286A3763|nr:T9SS type A sorting domain-containing protein [Flavobacterium sp.]
MRNLILSLFLTISLNGFGQIQTRKVLFLGNSYTYVNDLPRIVSDLAANTGDILIYNSNLIGGYTLENHFASTVSKNKILSSNWDYIVLQEQSQRPAFIGALAFLNSFGDLKGFIKQNKPCAQITSFMTWGYQNGDTQNCATNPSVCTYTGMDNLIKDRYMEFSNVFESEVTPVGVVWRYIKQNYPNINLYQSDGSHPSLAGSYLAACCFYTSIFRKNPALISNNYGLDANTASIIRNATKTLVFDQMLNWYIGKYVPNANFNYKIGIGTNQIVIDSVTPTYRDSVIWDFGDGTTSTAALPPSHSYATEGNYTVKLTSNKCYLGQNLTSIFERKVNFCSHTNTILPNYLVLCPNVSGTISTQTADSYQWLDFYGNPIAGATNQSLTVFSGQSISVLTTFNGCTERSPQMVIDAYIDIGGGSPCNLGIIEVDKPYEITTFPNPTQNILNVQTTVIIKEISVYDVLGKKVITNKVSVDSVDVSNLAKGIYIIKVLGEDDKKFTAKFIKE